ncbi:MAG: TonB-dependent receptor [Novosphingobium sp.]
MDLRKAAIILCATTGLTRVDVALAQGSGEAVAANDIIVTARRVEERLQDVPISITVFSQEKLTERNVLSGDDLAKVTPGLTSNSQFGNENTAFTLRGFRQDIGTAATVGVYFGDVVAPRGGSAGIFAGDGAGVGNFFDLQNVQVLKGPQGTLQGRNTTGGAVMLVPQRPVDRFEGYVEGNFGNFDARGVQAVVNAPLSDSIRVRLGVDRQSRDGYVKNVSGTGVSDFNDVNYLALRFSAVVDLTPELENYTIASYAKSDTNGTANKLIAVDPTSQLAAVLGAEAQLRREAALGFYTAASIMPNQESRKKTWQVINTTKWLVSDNLTIKNIVSYAELKMLTNIQVFGTNFTLPTMFGPLPIYSNMIHSAPGLNNTSQSTFTEELQFQGSAMDGSLRWQAGAYYEKSSPLGASGNQTVGFGLCPAIGTANGFLPGCYGLPDFAGSYNFQVARTKFENKALYGQVTYDLTETLSLTGGFRYTWDKMRSVAQEEARDVNTGTLFCIETYAAPAGPACPIVDIQQKSSAPTWLIGLDFKPVEDVLLYAKYARGYRAGGVKNDAPNFSKVRADLPDYTVFKPEKLDSYEVGLKASFDGAVKGTVNLAAYYNDFSDQQVSLGIFLLPNAFLGGTAGACTLTPYTPCPVPVTVAGVPTSAPVNVGSSRIYGFDADVTLDLFDGFTAFAGYAYVNTKVKTLQGVAPIVFDNQTALTNAQAKVGFPLGYSPEHKLVLGADYALPLPEDLGRLSLGATFTYTSSYYTTFGSGGRAPLVVKNGAVVTTTADLGKIPSTSLLDMNLNWRGAFGSPFDLTFWATNLTGKKYISHVAGLLGYGFDVGQVGAPRMYGTKVRFRF